MSDRWGRLAQYNAEVHRGIVHTAEYDELMADEQRAFDAWQVSTWPDRKPMYDGNGRLVGWETRVTI